MKLVPASEFIPPERCPVRVTGEHRWRRKPVAPEVEQPFVIQADVCDHCDFIRPVRALREEPAAFVRKKNADCTGAGKMPALPGARNHKS